MAVQITDADIAAARLEFSGISDERVREFHARLLAAVAVNLSGPGEVFYLHSIARAHDFAVSQPCQCTYTEDGDPRELCQRCQVIGCVLDDHREGARCRSFVSHEEREALMRRMHEIWRTRPVGTWRLTRQQMDTVTSTCGGSQYVGPVSRWQIFGLPMEIVDTEAESTLS